MKKLSLRRVLKETEDDLEKWSSNLETLPVERAMQKGATKAMPTDVQKVWGGPPLEDDDLPPRGPAPSAGMIDQQKKMLPIDLASRYNLTQDDLDSISRGDFSGVAQRVGDLGNFAEDVADVFGKDIADKASAFALNLAPNAPMKLGPMYDRIHANQSVAKPPVAHAPTQMTDPGVRPTPPEPNPTNPGKKLRK